MFWIMMYMLFFGGDSIKPADALFADGKAFAKAIKDPVRLEKIMVMQEEMNALWEQKVQVSRALTEDLRKISLQHDTGMESFQALFTKLDTDRLEIQTQLLDFRFRVKEQMTEEEWEIVYGKW